MSHSNRHQVVPFVAGKTAPFTGQRLAKVGYKSTEKNPAKFPSVAVSVPQIALTDVEQNYKALLPHISTMLENAQDGLIRSLYEAKDGSLEAVSDDDISVPAIIAWMEAEATGDRLTKDAIVAWFDRVMADPIYVLIAEKLGFAPENGVPNQEQDAVIRKHVKVYKDVFSMLAGGKTILQEKQIKGCKTALALVEDDSVSVKLNARLTAMEKKPDLAEMLEL